VPIKFVYFTFGPFIWMTRNIATFFGSLEGLANLLFIILSWRGIKYLKLKNKSVAYFLLLFSFASLAAYGVIDSNFGTALRHRISFTFIFIILSSYSLARSKGILYLLSNIFILRSHRVPRGLILLFIGSALLFPIKNALSVEKDINKLPYEDDSVRIWSVNSLEKISSHYSISGTKSEFKDSIKINSAKNEYESFQVIISNKGDKILEINNIDISDLKSFFGRASIISKKNIEVFYVGYVNGEYPDVLFPTNVEKYRNEFKEIAKGENSNVWITIYVPPDIKAGEYNGTVNLQVNNKTFKIPILLKIWNFSLPQRTHVKTQLFEIDRKEIANRYNLNMFLEKYEQFVKINIFEEYKKHRISPGSPTPLSLRQIYKSNKDILYLANYFEKWCRYWVDAGLECNNIQTPEKLEDVDNYYKDIYRAIKGNACTDRVYIRLPNDEAMKAEQIEENIRWAKMLRKIMPGIKIHQTFAGLDKGLSKNLLEMFNGYVDIWSFPPDAYFKDEKIRYFIDDRIKKGGEMSWYIHGYIMVWKPLKNLRYFFWKMWANDVSMVTLWRTNFWSRPAKYKTVAGIKIPRVPEKKTWREKRGIGTTNTREGIGNGTLFWPDDDRMLTSIRLEVIRDGIEDYEYLIIAKKSNINVDTLKDYEDILKQRENLAYQIENISKK
jgi:competence transcription factor ComK